jgi:hypothetical protein
MTRQQERQWVSLRRDCGRGGELARGGVKRRNSAHAHGRRTVSGNEIGGGADSVANHAGVHGRGENGRQLCHIDTQYLHLEAVCHLTGIVEHIKILIPGRQRNGRRLRAQRQRAQTQSQQYCEPAATRSGRLRAIVIPGAGQGANFQFHRVSLSCICTLVYQQHASNFWSNPAFRQTRIGQSRPTTTRNPAFITFDLMLRCAQNIS